MCAGKAVRPWKDAKGRTRTAEMTKDGKPRISVEAKTYTAKYRDGSGELRRVTTGCRYEQAARAILARPGTAGSAGEGQDCDCRRRRRDGSFADPARNAHRRVSGPSDRQGLECGADQKHGSPIEAAQR